MGLHPARGDQPREEALRRQAVRRALTLALDRHQASTSLSKIAIVKAVAACRCRHAVRRTAGGAEQARRLLDRHREVARRGEKLLKEAGVPEGFQFTFTNRGIPMPYEPLGVWLIDQWRRAA